ncbi:hypothetical protein FANTH_8250 [Fusarium anthophilum]|uniref:Uncharacterized protein n=1 Tax=Fusarium anthophilum TaxID=48485 RepID=A0A8H4ZBW1_9HYPO|nr:hypothetical protein FANTH_8250 [Fusarium anthophilum]
MNAKLGSLIHPKLVTNLDDEKHNFSLFSTITHFKTFLAYTSSCSPHSTFIRPHDLPQWQGYSRNVERNPCLNGESWVALQAHHRMILQKRCEIPIATCSLSPQLRHFRKIAHEHSLQSRSLRRFSDCLLPLLKREQDLESAQQWVETMKLSSSLIELLGKNDLLYFDEERALMDTIKKIKALLSGLRLWFRRKYEDLSGKKDVTEEQSLVEPIVEFPNNIRHTCTTMPWTILPALLVLLGVCWMFIIGSSQPEHEWGNVADPIISLVPAAHDFCTDFPGIGIEEGLQGSVAHDFDNRGHFSQDILEELWPRDVQLMNDLMHPFTFSQNTPQDPNFLIPDMTSHGDSESLELAAQDTAEVLPVAAVKDSTLTACINTDNSVERDATGSADSSGYGQRTINADELPTDIWKAIYLKTTSNRETQRCIELGGIIAMSQYWLQKVQWEAFQAPRSTSISASPSIQHRQDVGPDEAIRANGTKKRPRAEDDEGSNDEFLLAQMVKKYRKMEWEIKEKQEGLEALEKAIQMLKGSLRNS